MVYTEIKKKNNRIYYYRVKSIREGNRINKKRKYLGANLTKKELNLAEKKADKDLLYLKNLLTKEETKSIDKIKKEYLKEPKENYNNRYEAFCALFTYDSTSIEGNSLTLREASSLLFDHITPSNTSLREVNEVLNHKKAFDYMINYKEDITKNFILDLHKLAIKDTLRQELGSQIGKYRDFQVYIRGADWIPPKPKEVPKEIKTLLSWYSKNKKELHPLILAAYFHVGFEIIHPFVDGNGRVGRLLMNFILHKNKYPMINILDKTKLKYYNSLKKAQDGGLRPFVELLFTTLKNSKIKF